ncbi:DUF2752 domain-containing protein [Mesoflavibacter sp. CH_XMU1422-2]|uniref:DUF2752 domain-containing protein n=1 Tax=Mesoflavibacter sp. CH_XMU1422-2 TaxID=3107770 RepID=UPI0030084D7B
MEDLNNYMLPCMNKQVLGFECPGCGIQRSVTLVAQGKLVDGFLMYPAIYTLSLLGIVILVSVFYKFKYSTKIISILAIISIILILTNFIYNLINHT